MRRIVACIITLILVIFIGAFFGHRWLLNWSQKTNSVLPPQIVQLTRGMPLAKFAKELEEHHIVDSGIAFRIWTRMNGEYSRFQAGLYRFEGPVTPQQIASDIIAGKTYNPVLFEVNVPEGFTSKKLLARLEELEFHDFSDAARLFTDQEFLKHLKIPGSSIEGFLFPATYSFTEYPDARGLLEKMVATFWERLPANYEERAKELGLTLEQAVIFASLIELESAQPLERPMIAEVIWNRLKMGMALGIDAAIIYGAKDYRGDLTWAHLRDSGNRYNTRIHGGLPPTAIGSPSLESLMAVLEPTHEGWLYYVAKPEGGAHTFSRSLNEHNKGVAALRRSTRRAKNS